MRWLEINETTLPRGPLSGFPIRNTDELGKLEDALCLWVGGDCQEAEPYLLAMRSEMVPFNPQQGVLYRGLVIDDIDQVHKAMRDGITITHQGKSLESWSGDAMACEDFMVGWDRPWIMIEADGSEMDTLIDLEIFDRDAKPFTRMHEQREVIVVAASSVHYPPSQISFARMEELEQYEDSLDEGVETLIYGYWVSPQGDVYPVGYENHDEAIYEIENISYGDAIHTGWIRVTGRSWCWNIEAGAGLKRAGLSALSTLMKDGRGANIDVHDLIGDEELFSYQTSSPRQTMAILNAYRRGVLKTDEDLKRFRIR